MENLCDKNICKEDNSIVMGDDAVIIFLNAGMNCHALEQRSGYTREQMKGMG